MALWLVSSDPFDYQCRRPTRLRDQHFGHGLEADDLLAPIVRSLMHSPTGYRRPWTTQASQRDSGSTVSIDKDRFQAHLDVQQFKPEEITVKVTGDNTVTIEGQHEEKQDEHGYISRHFVRKYVLPQGHDVNRIESRLSSDGVLTITAPKIAPAGEEESRNIPITHTGQAFKAVEEKEKKKEN